MNMKLFGLTETKLFHFHRIFGAGLGFKRTPEPLLDLLLRKMVNKRDSIRLVHEIVALAAKDLTSLRMRI